MSGPVLPGYDAWKLSGPPDYDTEECFSGNTHICGSWSFYICDGEGGCNDERCECDDPEICDAEHCGGRICPACLVYVRGLTAHRKCADAVREVEEREDRLAAAEGGR